MRISKISCDNVTSSPIVLKLSDLILSGETEILLLVDCNGVACFDFKSIGENHQGKVIHIKNLSKSNCVWRFEGLFDFNEYSPAFTASLAVVCDKEMCYLI